MITAAQDRLCSRSRYKRDIQIHTDQIMSNYKRSYLRTNWINPIVFPSIKEGLQLILGPLTEDLAQQRIPRSKEVLYIASRWTNLWWQGHQWAEKTSRPHTSRAWRWRKKLGWCQMQVLSMIPSNQESHLSKWRRTKWWIRCEWNMTKVDWALVNPELVTIQAIRTRRRAISNNGFQTTLLIKGIPTWSWAKQLKANLALLPRPRGARFISVQIFHLCFKIWNWCKRK